VRVEVVVELECVGGIVGLEEIDVLLPKMLKAGSPSDPKP
jgi:hypothetical protein